MSQTASHIIMVEPRGFCSNPQTAITNTHQADNPDNTEILQEKALIEHRAFQQLLREHGVKVTVFEGQISAPDDLFCNNWIMVRPEGYALFPMLAPNRRIERRTDVQQVLLKPFIKDYSFYEEQGKFLESTGSLVLDHVNKIAYAALSPRTDEELVKNWCEDFGYQPLLFKAYDKYGKPEYHTNVVMFIGKTMAGICLHNIDGAHRAKVKETLEHTHKILELTSDQIVDFAGNALEVHNREGKQFLVISRRGYEALTLPQKDMIAQHVDGVITPDLEYIETYGGGSARCMMLEVF